MVRAPLATDQIMPIFRAKLNIDHEKKSVNYALNSVPLGEHGTLFPGSRAVGKLCQCGVGGHFAGWL